jgi:hypothetical protein
MSSTFRFSISASEQPVMTSAASSEALSALKATSEVFGLKKYEQPTTGEPPGSDR